MRNASVFSEVHQHDLPGAGGSHERSSRTQERVPAGEMEDESSIDPAERLAALLELVGLSQQTSAVKSSQSALVDLEHWTNLSQQSANGALDALPEEDVPMRRPYELIINAMEYDVEIVDIAKIEFVELIGSGANMNVYKGTVNGSVVAIKRVRPFHHTTRTSRTPEITLPTLDMEIRVMSDVFLQDDENIAKLRALSWEISKEGELTPILVMDLAEPTCPSLCELMQNLDRCDYGRKAYLISDIVSGLNAIHAEQIVHGDLKPENLLCFRRRREGAIDQTMPLMLKISDFGFSEDIHKDYPSSSGLEAGGTEYWNAPECMPDAPENMKPFSRRTERDVYSCGLVLWYILDSKLPLGPAGGPVWATHRESIRKKKISGEVHSMFQDWFPENMRRIWSPDAQTEVDLFKTELFDDLPDYAFAQKAKIQKIATDPNYAEQIMFDELLFRNDGKVSWFSKADDGEWQSCPGYLAVMVPNVVANMLQLPSLRKPISAAVDFVKLFPDRKPDKIYNHLNFAFENRGENTQRRGWSQYAVRYRHPFGSARKLQNISPQMHSSIMAELHKDADGSRPSLRAVALLSSIYSTGYGVDADLKISQQYLHKASILSAGTSLAESLEKFLVLSCYRSTTLGNYPFDAATELRGALTLLSDELNTTGEYTGPKFSAELFEKRVTDVISDLEWRSQSRFLRMSISAYITHQMIKEGNRTDPLLREPDDGGSAVPAVRGAWVHTLLQDNPTSFELLQNSGLLPEELSLTNNDMDAFMFAAAGIRLPGVPQLSRQDIQAAMLQGVLKRGTAEKNLIRICAEYGLVNLLRHLIKNHKFNVNRKLDDDQNALQEVLEQGRVHRAVSLLSCGADIKAVAEESFIKHICADGHSKAIDFWAQLDNIHNTPTHNYIELNLDMSIQALFDPENEDFLDLESQRFESYDDSNAPVVEVCPMYFSMSDNTWSTFIALLRFGVDPAEPVTGSLNALESAVVMNRPLFVATLLGPEYESSFSHAGHGTRSLFHLASLGDQYFRSDKVWVYGDSNDRNEYPDAPLDDKKHHQIIILELLHRNLTIEVDQRDELGLTPFLLAVAQDNITAAEWFMAHDANSLATALDGTTALHLAIASGSERMIQYILCCAPELISSADDLGQTPLHYAVCQPNMAILNMILSEGPDLDVIDCFARNPAILALDHGQVFAFLRYIQAVVEHTDPGLNVWASFNAKDAFGRSCAHVLPKLETGLAETLVDILQAENNGFPYDYNEYYDGADIWTPVHLAVVGNLDLLSVLLTSRTVNIKGYLGLTPLHLAYLLQNEQLVERLINLGANPSIFDDFGRLPIALLQPELLPIESHTLLDIMLCIYTDLMIDRAYEAVGKTIVVRPFVADIYKSEEIFIGTYLDAFKEKREGENMPALNELKDSFKVSLKIFRTAVAD